MWHCLKTTSVPSPRSFPRIRTVYVAAIRTIELRRHLGGPSQELDEITLHNLALIEMDSNPTAGFAKLQFLLQAREQVPLPFLL